MKFDIATRNGQTVVTAKGRLDEGSDEPLKDLARKLPKGDLVFDLDGVDMINSTGAGMWLDFVEKLPPRGRLTFERCSPTFVSYCNMFTGFTGSGTVTSFYYPTYCKHCDQVDRALVDGKVASHDTLTLPACEKCQGPSDPEIDPEIYLTGLKTA